MNNAAIERKIVPLISVVLPVFNAEKYVTEAVQSILDQTFSNFELILINDGSTDGSLKILKKFKKNDNRVVLISRKNKGLVASLNEGISLARGEWIARMDADDIALPQRFECQLKWLDETQADICGSWVRFFGASDNRIMKHAVSDEAIKTELLFCCAFAHPTVIMRTKLIRELRYDKDWDKAEDYELWVRAACSNLKMTNIPIVLLLYRQHETQISNKSSILQQELSQDIRRIYWSNLSTSLGINMDEINNILSLWSPSKSKFNLQEVHAIISKLAYRTKGESTKVFFHYVTQLYFNVASYSKCTPFYWYSINIRLCNRFGLKTFCIILLKTLFNPNSGGNLFKQTKRIYHHFKWLKI
jgi:glycosyltransferase involved in cell wall biosynthesis